MSVVPVVEPAPVVIDQNDSEFDDAFNEAVGATPEPETSEEPETPEAPETPESPEAPETPETPEPEPTPDPLEQMRNELERMRAELEAARKPEPKAPEPAAAEPEPEPIYTPEQETQLAEFRKEWPEVANGLDLMFAGMEKKLAQVISQQIFGQLGPVLTPMAEQYQVTAEQSQYSAIKAVHEDYDNIYEDVLKWVDKQPSYMKTALEHVVTQGSADEVNDMISRYKKETGTVAPAAAAPKQETALPETAKQVAKSLGVVSSKRSAVPQSQDPTDFDSAWATAVNE